MIDRNQVNKFLDVMEQLTDEDATFSVHENGKLELVVYPKGWVWEGQRWSEEKRHKMLALITPLVGKLEKRIDGRDIGYEGKSDTASVRLSYVEKCKILGYKTVTKTVKEEIEREPEYVEKEIEERVAITDCDIRTGRFREDDIEVKA